MFIEIQTIAKYFTNPLIIIFGSFIWFTFKLSEEKKLFISLVLIFYIISVPISGKVFQNIWKINNTYDSDKIYDIVLVLAGGVDSKWYIEDIVKNSYIYDSKDYFKFNDAAERIYAAIHFIKTGTAEKIYYSNFSIEKNNYDKIYTFDVSDLVKKFAMNHGVEFEDFIIYGDRVKRTLDEAVQFKNNYSSKDSENILLITSQLHMRRAFKLFKKKDIILDLYSVEVQAPIKEYFRNINNYIPSIEGLKITKMNLYEFFGYVGYYLKGDI